VGAGVLDDVGERLGHDEVRRRLDGGRQALVGHVDGDRQRRALGQLAHRGRQAAAAEDARKRPAGQLAQLHGGLLGLLERLGDQRGRVVGPVAERALGELERDDRVDEALLRAVVDVADQAAPLFVGRREHAGALRLERLHADARGLVDAGLRRVAQAVGDDARGDRGDRQDHGRDDVEERERDRAGGRGQQCEAQVPARSPVVTAGRRRGGGETEHARQCRPADVWFASASGQSWRAPAGPAPALRTRAARPGRPSRPPGPGWARRRRSATGRRPAPGSPRGGAARCRGCSPRRCRA
jgi:hypothetical protein